MLSALKFVQGAVARKDFVPVLSHFRIQDRRVFGFNGAIALSSPIGMDLACTPKATDFIKAIQTCDDIVQLHLTDAGRLSIQSGQFQAFVECSQEPFPPLPLVGTRVSLPSGFVEAIKAVSQFVAEDASRPWARAVRFSGSSVIATNNIILVQKWIGQSFPSMTVPQDAIREILRIGEDPKEALLDTSAATFLYEGDRWLRCQLVDTSWPIVDDIFVDEDPDALPPVPPGLGKALDDIAPFADDLRRVFVTPGRVRTSEQDGAGALANVEGLVGTCCFNIDQLRMAASVSTRMDLSRFPAPCAFYGDALRGIIVGMHT